MRSSLLCIDIFFRRRHQKLVAGLVTFVYLNKHYYTFCDSIHVHQVNLAMVGVAKNRVWLIKEHYLHMCQSMRNT